jgi:hypothetical protein
MDRLSTDQRYGEAAGVRDRHDALVRALRRKWDWNALTGAGWMELEHADGTTAIVDHGTLVETRPAGQPPRLRSSQPASIATTSVPPSVEAGEEAAILWRWLETNQVKIVECFGEFAYPIQRVESLTVARRLAA